MLSSEAKREALDPDKRLPIYLLQKTRHLAGTSVDKRRTLSEAGPQRRAPVVVFQELSLLVKWGTAMRISEGQCLCAIGQLLKDYVPVLELYTWRQDGGETFLYMKYLDS
ncbi:uncharacterized protein N7496_011056 [Penicillium cataractarum]|uniref:Uncharacterized protein n=1 Tax=Penicillium cataractarum TaxID=2100454 RepID=A0A9W9UV42_9EURO|nr:uncharacterized protein N7496_011056 [Penicillium cataractarum]KAJ5358643.1 hypothetical protein N7496_011056 [Penicillium cataractarum]